MHTEQPPAFHTCPADSYYDLTNSSQLGEVVVVVGGGMCGMLGGGVVGVLCGCASLESRRCVCGC